MNAGVAVHLGEALQLLDTGQSSGRFFPRCFRIDDSSAALSLRVCTTASLMPGNPPRTRPPSPRPPCQLPPHPRPPSSAPPAAAPRPCGKLARMALADFSSALRREMTLQAASFW